MKLKTTRAKLNIDSVLDVILQSRMPRMCMKHEVYREEIMKILWKVIEGIKGFSKYNGPYSQKRTNFSPGLVLD